MQQKVNRSYTIHTQQSVNLTPLSPYKSTKSKRISSLQKIRINQKGLPVDFFKPHTSRECPKTQRKHTRSHTMPVEAEQIRSTPQFPQSLTLQHGQPRQYKSEQRKIKMITKPSEFSENFVQFNMQLTFSKSFFVEEKKLRQTSIKKRNHRQDSITKNQFLQPQKWLSPTPKRDLNDLISKKYTYRDKYTQWQQGRVLLNKSKNTLPILKARFPSAFGK